MKRLKAPERRQQLIDVAVRLFAERGFDATTTAGIAAAAGVSEPILYRHFRSKQDLFVAIVTEVTRKTQQHWRDLMANITDPAHALYAISVEWPSHLQQTRDEHAVIHNAMVTSKDPEVLAVLRQHFREMEAFFTELVRRGQELGTFKVQDIKTAVWWLMSYGIGYTFMLVSLGPPAGFEFVKGIELNMLTLGASPLNADGRASSTGISSASVTPPA